jgi:hypothetical protein
MRQVGQQQGGFMGFLQRVTKRAEHHIWFQRSEAKDRMAVAKRFVSVFVVVEEIVLKRREPPSDKCRLNVCIFLHNGVQYYAIVGQFVCLVARLLNGKT